MHKTMIWALAKPLNNGPDGNVEVQCTLLQSAGDVAYVVKFMGALELGDVASLN